MLRISTITKMNSQEAIKKAVSFFGAGGYGLEVKEETPSYACFEGGGRGVEVTACAEEKGSSVELILGNGITRYASSSTK